MAANFAFEVCEKLGLEKCTFEGDAKFVVLVVWKARDQIKQSRQFLSTHPLWFFNYVDKKCNVFSHNLVN